MKAEATEKQTIWEERVRAWRASGVSARRFAEAEGFSVSTLRYWWYRLNHPSEAPRFLRLVPKEVGAVAPPETSLAPEPVPAAASRMAIEVGRARVVVQSGFDRRLLTEVVVALSGVAR